MGTHEVSPQDFGSVVCEVAAWTRLAVQGGGIGRVQSDLLIAVTATDVTVQSRNCNSYGGTFFPAPCG